MLSLLFEDSLDENNCLPSLWDVCMQRIISTVTTGEYQSRTSAPTSADSLCKIRGIGAGTGSENRALCLKHLLREAFVSERDIWRGQQFPPLEKAPTLENGNKARDGHSATLSSKYGLSLEDEISIRKGTLMVSSIFSLNHCFNCEKKQTVTLR